MEAVKAYRPASNSLSSGQVLAEPYTWAKARVVTLEMADALALSLLDKRLVSNRLTLTVGYDVANLTDPAICAAYQGEVVTDHYGRLKPRHTHGTLRLELPTSSMRTLGEAAAQLYDRVANPLLLVRRLTLCVADVTDEAEAERQRRNRPVTLSLFDDHDAQLRALAEKERSEQRERQMQEAMLAIKKRFGKNAILTGLNFADGATAKERNTQIGGHKA
jgi:DNA polymerase V